MGAIQGELDTFCDRSLHKTKEHVIPNRCEQKIHENNRCTIKLDTD